MTAPSQRQADDLAGVLHDVSNALTVLLGWVGEARAPDATPESIAYALTIIEQRARIARDLARQAIGGARVEGQREVGSIVEEVAHSLKVEAQHATVRLLTRGTDVAAKVAGALDLSQVLTNLALNAIAFSPASSTIEITVSAVADRCTVVVADQGPGISGDRRELVFAGQTTRPGGSGVGLRHSRAIARAWGGDVVLESNGLPGAHFRVTWPRGDAVPRAPSSTTQVSDLSGMRVLVVEDDPAVTQLLDAALGARGADITTASTVEALMTAIGKAPFDAVLVDLSPIATDAEGALAAVRAKCPNADVVLITGNADGLPESIVNGVQELVRKPFEVREVVAALLRGKDKRA